MTVPLRPTPLRPPDPPQRIAIVSDAWHPQVNGVVRTLDTVVRELRAAGHEVLVIGPGSFRTVPCPTYPEIRLAILPGRHLGRLLQTFAPDSLHVATEGPLGLAARRWALQRRHRFTTSLHTRFPEYVHARFGLPAAPFWAMLRRFHAPADATLVATEGLRRELDARGFRGLRLWSRGVDTALFRPGPRREWGLPRPVLLCVGRVAPEKNIQAFLELDVPGTKVVVGDGPQLAQLRAAFPGAVFTGTLRGEELAAAYAGADAFVFPSRTDTFGLVMLEALACGTPVAAYPVQGPAEVLTPGVGALDDDLAVATRRALLLDRAACRTAAEAWSWQSCAASFLHALVPLRRRAPAGVAGCAVPGGRALGHVSVP